MAINIFVISINTVSVCSSEEIVLQMSTEAGTENYSKHCLLNRAWVEFTETTLDLNDCCTLHV